MSRCGITTSFLTGVLALSFAAVASANPAHLPQIELAAADSPYMQIEALKQKLADTEQNLQAAQKNKQKPLPAGMRELMNENPELLPALVSEGWEAAYFKGLGEVQIKATASRMLIKIPSKRSVDALLVMGKSIRTMVSCGNSNTCFSLDNSALASKPKNNEGQVTYAILIDGYRWDRSLRRMCCRGRTV